MLGPKRNQCKGCDIGWHQCEWCYTFETARIHRFCWYWIGAVLAYLRASIGSFKQWHCYMLSSQFKNLYMCTLTPASRRWTNKQSVNVIVCILIYIMWCGMCVCLLYVSMFHQLPLVTVWYRGLCTHSTFTASISQFEHSFGFIHIHMFSDRMYYIHAYTNTQGEVQYSLNKYTILLQKLATFDLNSSQ